MTAEGTGGTAPSKKILIIAGPNGAGKTTFATEFLLNEADCPTFVNADLIASGVNPFQPERSAVLAGRLMLDMMEEYVNREESFAFEITLSGRGFARHIPRWREQGYWVKLYFLRLPSADMAVARVRNRVRRGGHDVPEEAIRRRFDAGWRNFNLIYKGLVDEWAVYNGSQSPPLMTEYGEKMKTDGKTGGKQTSQQPSADSLAALAALRRAAVKARRESIEATGSVPTWRDGKIVYETEV